MATNVSFFVQIEDSSGNVLFKKDIDPASELTFTKDGGPYVPGSKINNGDGSYYFTITESGKYSLLINGIEQDEFKDTYIAGEDSLTQQNIDGTPTKGQVILNSDILEIQDAATIVLEGEIVNNLVSSNTDKALSAAQGKTLKDVQDLQLLISNIINDLVSSDTDKPLSALQGKNLQDDITLSFAGAYFISDDFNISQNFERLDQAVYNNLVSFGSISQETIFRSGNIAAAGAGSTPSALVAWNETSGSYVVKLLTSYQYQSDSNTIQIRCDAKQNGGGTGTIKLTAGALSVEHVVTVSSYFTQLIQLQISGVGVSSTATDITVEMKQSGGSSFDVRRMEIVMTKS